MNYCHYHPLAAATYVCSHCQLELCDQCTDEGDFAEDYRCFLCEREVDSLGSANQAEPFWSRFDKSFRYPLNIQTMVLIIILSLLTAVLEFIPFSTLIYLAVMGALLKYSFSCLQETANGLMLAPDITASYGDGLALVCRLLIIFVLVLGSINVANQVFGPVLAALLGTVLIIALPATLIIFAMSDSIIAAINPLKQTQLMTSIGLPYALLLVIIIIMSSSVGVLSGVIGNNYSFLSVMLQAMVSNYYTIVVFHIMGYMLFQYQAELGFTARENFGEKKTARPELARMMARIKIIIKEGNYNLALKLFSQTAKRHPNSSTVNSEFFTFLLATKNSKQIDKLAPLYLHFLESNQQSYKLTMSYKMLLQVHPHYLPNTAELRFCLAKACFESNALHSAVKLIKGLHKDFPDYEQLVPAYELMADALDKIPEMNKQAGQCRDFIKRLQQKTPSVKLEKNTTQPKKPHVNVAQKGLAPKQAELQLTLLPIDDEESDDDAGSHSSIDFR